MVCFSFPIRLSDGRKNSHLRGKFGKTEVVKSFFRKKNLVSLNFNSLVTTFARTQAKKLLTEVDCSLFYDYDTELLSPTHHQLRFLIFNKYNILLPYKHLKFLTENNDEKNYQYINEYYPGLLTIENHGFTDKIAKNLMDFATTLAMKHGQIFDIAVYTSIVMQLISITACIYSMSKLNTTTNYIVQSLGLTAGLTTILAQMTLLASKQVASSLPMFSNIVSSLVERLTGQTMVTEEQLTEDQKVVYDMIKAQVTSHITSNLKSKGLDMNVVENHTNTVTGQVSTCTQFGFKRWFDGLNTESIIRFVCSLVAVGITVLSSLTGKKFDVTIARNWQVTRAIRDTSNTIFDFGQSFLQDVFGMCLGEDAVIMAQHSDMENKANMFLTKPNHWFMEDLQRVYEYNALQVQIGQKLQLKSQSKQWESFNRLLNFIYLKMIDKSRELNELLLSHSARPETIAMQIFGLEGTGKSYFAKNYLLREIALKMGKDPLKSVLALSITDDYFPVLAGQEFVLWDEFGARREEDPIFKEMNNILSTNYVNLAGAFAKTQPCNWRLLCLGSNMARVNVTKKYHASSQKAMYSRIHTYEVENVYWDDAASLDEKGNQVVDRASIKYNLDWTHLKFYKVFLNDKGETLEDTDGRPRRYPITKEQIVSEMVSRISYAERLHNTVMQLNKDPSITEPQRNAQLQPILDEKESFQTIFMAGLKHEHQELQKKKVLEKKEAPRVDREKAMRNIELNQISQLLKTYQDLVSELSKKTFSRRTNSEQQEFYNRMLFLGNTVEGIVSSQLISEFHEVQTSIVTTLPDLLGKIQAKLKSFAGVMLLGKKNISWIGTPLGHEIVPFSSEVYRKSILMSGQDISYENSSVIGKVQDLPEIYCSIFGKNTVNALSYIEQFLVINEGAEHADVMDFIDSFVSRIRRPIIILETPDTVGKLSLTSFSTQKIYDKQNLLDSFSHSLLLQLEKTKDSWEIRVVKKVDCLSYLQPPHYNALEHMERVLQETVDNHNEEVIDNNFTILITGRTDTGKTRRAIKIAEDFRKLFKLEVYTAVANNLKDIQQEISNKEKKCILVTNDCLHKYDDYCSLYGSLPNGSIVINTANMDFSRSSSFFYSMGLPLMKGTAITSGTIAKVFGFKGTHEAIYEAKHQMDALVQGKNVVISNHNCSLEAEEGWFRRTGYDEPMNTMSGKVVYPSLAKNYHFEMKEGYTPFRKGERISETKLNNELFEGYVHFLSKSEEVCVVQVDSPVLIKTMMVADIDIIFHADTTSTLLRALQSKALLTTALLSPSSSIGIYLSDKFIKTKQNDFSVEGFMLPKQKEFLRDDITKFAISCFTYLRKDVTPYVVKISTNDYLAYCKGSTIWICDSSNGVMNDTTFSTKINESDKNVEITFNTIKTNWSFEDLRRFYEYGYTGVIETHRNLPREFLYKLSMYEDTLKENKEYMKHYLSCAVVEQQREFALMARKKFEVMSNSIFTPTILKVIGVLFLISLLAASITGIIWLCGGFKEKSEAENQANENLHIPVPYQLKLDPFFQDFLEHETVFIKSLESDYTLEDHVSTQQSIYWIEVEVKPTDPTKALTQYLQCGFRRLESTQDEEKKFESFELFVPNGFDMSLITKRHMKAFREFYRSLELDEKIEKDRKLSEHIVNQNLQVGVATTQTTPVPDRSALGRRESDTEVRARLSNVGKMLAKLVIHSLTTLKQSQSRTYQKELPVFKATLSDIQEDELDPLNDGFVKTQSVETLPPHTQNSTDILSSIVQHFRRAVVRVSTKKSSLHGINFKDDLVITTSHLYLYDCEEEETFIEDDYCHSLNNGKKWKAKIKILMRSNEITILQIMDKKRPMGKNLIPYFTREIDLPKINDVIYTRVIGDNSIEYHYGNATLFTYSEQKPLYGSGGMAITERAYDVSFVKTFFSLAKNGDCGFPYFAKDATMGGAICLGMHVGMWRTSNVTITVLVTQEILKGMCEAIVKDTCEVHSTVEYPYNRSSVIEIAMRKDIKEHVEKYYSVKPVISTELAGILEHADYDSEIFPPCEIKGITNPTIRENIEWLGYNKFWNLSGKPEKSKFLRSPLSRLINREVIPCLNTPAIHDYHLLKDKSNLVEMSNGTPSIMWTQIMKYGQFCPELSDERLQFVLESLFPHYLDMYGTTKHKFLSVSETINGLPPGGVLGTGLDRINLDSSPGIVCQKLFKITSKKTIFRRLTPKSVSSRDHFVFADSEAGRYVSEAYKYTLSDLAKGLSTIRPFKDALKSELIPLDKAAIGKTRLFTVCDVVDLLVTRTICGSMMAIMKNKRSIGHCQVGIDPILEFTDLYARLSQIGVKAIAFDVKNFDKAVHRKIAKTCFDLWAKVFSYDPEKSESEELVTRAFDHVALQTIHSLVISRGNIYFKHRGVPSGCAVTTYINSTVNDFSMVMVLLQFLKDINLRGFPPTMKTILKNFDWINCGDDFVLVISDALTSYVTFELFQQYYKDLCGMEITNPDKISTTTGVRDLEGIEFISRRFVRDRGSNIAILAPLKLISLGSFVHWTTSLHDNHLRELVFGVLLDELALHEKEVYEAWTRELQAVVIPYFRARGSTSNELIPTWSTAREYIRSLIAGGSKRQPNFGMGRLISENCRAFTGKIEQNNVETVTNSEFALPAKKSQISKILTELPDNHNSENEQGNMCEDSQDMLLLGKVLLKTHCEFALKLVPTQTQPRPWEHVMVFAPIPQHNEIVRHWQVKLDEASGLRYYENVNDLRFIGFLSQTVLNVDKECRVQLDPKDLASEANSFSDRKYQVCRAQKYGSYEVLSLTNSMLPETHLTPSVEIDPVTRDPSSYFEVTMETPKCRHDDKCSTFCTHRLKESEENFDEVVVPSLIGQTEHEFDFYFGPEQRWINVNYPLSAMSRRARTYRNAPFLEKYFRAIFTHTAKMGVTMDTEIDHETGEEVGVMPACDEHVGTSYHDESVGCTHHHCLSDYHQDEGTRMHIISSDLGVDEHEVKNCVEHCREAFKMKMLLTGKQPIRMTDDGISHILSGSALHQRFDKWFKQARQRRELFGACLQQNSPATHSSAIPSGGSEISAPIISAATSGISPHSNDVTQTAGNIPLVSAIVSADSKSDTIMPIALQNPLAISTVNLKRGGILHSKIDAAYNRFYTIGGEVSVSSDTQMGAEIYRIGYGPDMLGGHAKDWIKLHERYVGSIDAEVFIVGSAVFRGKVMACVFPFTPPKEVTFEMMEEYGALTLPLNSDGILPLRLSPVSGTTLRAYFNSSTPLTDDIRPTLIVKVWASLQNPMDSTKAACIFKIRTRMGSDFMAVKPKFLSAIAPLPTSGSLSVPSSIGQHISGLSLGDIMKSYGWSVQEDTKFNIYIDGQTYPRLTSEPIVSSKDNRVFGDTLTFYDKIIKTDNQVKFTAGFNAFNTPAIGYARNQIPGCAALVSENIDFGVALYGENDVGINIYLAESAGSINWGELTKWATKVNLDLQNTVFGPLNRPDKANLRLDYVDGYFGESSGFITAVGDMGHIQHGGEENLFFFPSRVAVHNENCKYHQFLPTPNRNFDENSLKILTIEDRIVNTMNMMGRKAFISTIGVQRTNPAKPALTGFINYSDKIELVRDYGPTNDAAKYIIKEEEMGSEVVALRVVSDFGTMDIVYTSYNIRLKGRDWGNPGFTIAESLMSGMATCNVEKLYTLPTGNLICTPTSQMYDFTYSLPGDQAALVFGQNDWAITPSDYQGWIMNPSTERINNFFIRLFANFLGDSDDMLSFALLNSVTGNRDLYVRYYPQFREFIIKLQQQTPGPGTYKVYNGGPPEELIVTDIAIESKASIFNYTDIRAWLSRGGLNSRFGKTIAHDPPQNHAMLAGMVGGGLLQGAGQALGSYFQYAQQKKMQDDRFDKLSQLSEQGYDQSYELQTARLNQELNNQQELAHYRRDLDISSSSGAINAQHYGLGTPQQQFVYSHQFTPSSNPKQQPSDDDSESYVSAGGSTYGSFATQSTGFGSADQGSSNTGSYTSTDPYNFTGKF